VTDVELLAARMVKLVWPDRDVDVAAGLNAILLVQRRTGRIQEAYDEALRIVLNEKGEHQ
jgi:hypothetical protein